MLGVDVPGWLLWSQRCFTSKPNKHLVWVSFSRIVWLFICLLGPYKEEADIAAISPRKNS